MDIDGLRHRVHDQMGRVRTELAELVAIASGSDPDRYPPGECARAAQWVLAAGAAAGLRDVRLVRTADGSDVVYGERPGPPGAPTVLLCAHYDVGPPLDDAGWHTPPFTLTERDGRWYGRGAAHGKGDVLMHLTALRALGDDVPVGLKFVVDGSRERGSAGLAAAVPGHADLLRADAILVGGAGNAAVGVPTVTTSLRGRATVVVTVETLGAAVDPGRFGGAAPDALAALVHLLATLRDARGNTTIPGLSADGVWDGVPYPETSFRRDATVLDGVSLLGDGAVADMVWARPAVTILGVDGPSPADPTAAIPPRAAARLDLRVPPGTEAAVARDALVAQLRAAAPGGVRVTVEAGALGEPFRALTTGPAYAALAEAVRLAYGKQLSTQGQGGDNPLCTVLAATYPAAEIILLGVGEPASRTHGPNESVDPTEIENMALTEALFLHHYAVAAV